MPSLESLQKEIDSLKRRADDADRRIGLLQKLLPLEASARSGAVAARAVSSGAPVPSDNQTQSAGQEDASGSGTPGWAVMLIIIGSLLTLTGFGAIIGLPLLIWGIIVATGSGKKSADVEDTVQVVTDQTQQEEEQVTEKPAVARQAKAQDKVPQPHVSFEEDVGIKWFARIGIFALVIGIGFFIKYSIDMGWIGHLARILLGAGIGIGLVAFGEWVSRKEGLDLWGKTLVGGGIAITYFVTYASYHFAEYREAIGMVLWLNMVLLTLIVIGAVMLSIRDGSRVIAAGAFTLGYVTAVLSAPFGMITLMYTLLLSAGLVATVILKGWSAIGIGGVIASYVVYALGGVPEQFGFGAFFLIVFFLMFMLQSAILSRSGGVGEVIAMVLLNALLFFSLFFTLLDFYAPGMQGGFLFLLAGFFVVCFRLGKDAFASVCIYLGLFFLALAIPIQFNAQWVTIVWALLALLLVALFTRHRVDALRYGAYGVSVFVVFKTLMYDLVVLRGFDAADLFGSTRPLSLLVTIACFFGIYLLLRRVELPDGESWLRHAYAWVATVLAATFLLVEFSLMWSSLLLMVMAAVLVTRSKDLRDQAIGISMLILFKLLFFDAPGLAGAERIAVFIAGIAVSLLMRNVLREVQSLRRVYVWAPCLLIVVLIFLELASVWVSISLAGLALVLTVLSRRDADLTYPSIIVSGIMLGKVILVDSWALPGVSPDWFLRLLEGSLAGVGERIFAFIAAIAALAGMSWYRERRMDQEDVSAVYSYAASFLAFMFILIEFSGFGVSVGWLVLAVLLMTIGFTARNRHVRMQALIVFALTILKVFLYDTRNLETLLRTFSYILLGVILLLVSFSYTRFKEKLRELL